MHKAQYIICIAVMSLMMAGCTGNGGTKHVAQESDFRAELLRANPSDTMNLDYSEQVKWASELATLDKIISQLDSSSVGFAEFDTCIIAMKRKLMVLSILSDITMPGDSPTVEQCHQEMIRLAERFIAKLDDYEQHPQDRQPDSNEVAGYCSFYRSQAYLFLAQAYASSDNLEKARHYATIIEQPPFGRQRERVIHVNYLLVNIFIGMVMFVIATAAVYLYWQRRLLSEKNRILIQKIVDCQEYKRLYHSMKSKKNGGSAKPDDDMAEPALEAMTDAELFDYISEVVRREQLFLNPVCDRQMLVEQFHLSEKRIGAAFSKGSSFRSVSNFVRDARLEYACQLLRNSPNMPITDIAAASGFPSYPRFATDFKAIYSISPTEYRHQSQA